MRLYRLLLHLFPVSFPTEYGDEMRTIFAERRRRQSSAISIDAGQTIAEVLVNAIGALAFGSVSAGPSLKDTNAAAVPAGSQRSCVAPPSSTQDRIDPV